MVYFLFVRSENLHFRREKRKKFDKAEITSALQISLPVAFQNILSGGAQIVATGIVAPLGPVAISANSFAVTTEGFCYMPGFGIAAAATTMVGQSIGAGRKKTAKRLGWICILSGMVIMTLTGALMYIFSYPLIGLLSPVEDIRELGAAVLRIEAFAEPFFAAQIVGSGVFRGFKDTLGPSIIDFGTMWLVRLPLAYVLARMIGLRGVWIAMCLQLIIEGIIFLVRMALKNRNVVDLVEE
jgi:putative MATE family efflux protein